MKIKEFKNLSVSFHSIVPDPDDRIYKRIHLYLFIQDPFGSSDLELVIEMRSNQFNSKLDK